ncbi:unnamed protein product [Brachionus calyciflorus]|uniref:PHD-type domain-containing protein n=1 Tax=Brachionus calyciflorus TaxID=104777 RepID=A0A814JBP8_9BILA|nr:unnamed protein product [Brachionus calyciflorus]
MESYEQVVKKLINIIQLKNDDNVKQLENLWETINKEFVQVKPNNTENALKRSHENDSISNFCDLPNKKIKGTNQTPKPNSPVQKSKQIATIKHKIDSADQSSSNSSYSLCSNSEKSYNINDLFDVEMLDFSCFFCKQLNQELNNKLIECKKCSKLFHQKCHIPKIDETKALIITDDDDKMQWFIEKCQNCLKIINEEDEQTRMGPNFSKESFKSLSTLSNTFSSSKISKSVDKKIVKPLSPKSQSTHKNIFNINPITVSTKK